MFQECNIYGDLVFGILLDAYACTVRTLVNLPSDYCAKMYQLTVS